MIVRVHKCRPIMKLPILAWAIMLFQGMKPWNRSAYSHMALSYLSLTGDWKFADSTGKGVSDRPRTRFMSHYLILDTKIVSINSRPEEFLEWFEEHEGKEYDRWQIVGLLFKMVGLFTVNKFGANWKKLTCNELILSFLVRFKGVEISDSDDYDLNQVWGMI